jgi:para-aminobenzoate synthetase/4-amino-4-deoxychorismate lyase
VSGSVAAQGEQIARVDGPRPDPARGVFETTLVVDGAPLAVEAHLERLRGSLLELYGQEPPAGADELVRAAAAGTALGRVRLAVGPELPDGEVKLAEVEPALVFPDWAGALELAPVLVPGGVGAHKWADRRLLDRAEAEVGAPLALLVDEDGAVLEGTRGNLFAVVDGALVTPELDGRLLPGVTRGQVVAAARSVGVAVREEELPLDALASADEAFMTGAVRGIEPVRACAGVGEWAHGELTRQVTAELRRLWLG